MKRSINIIFLIIFGMIMVNSCNYFEDPTIDENGKRIPLAVLSNLTYDTKLYIELSDIEGIPLSYSTINFTINGDEHLVNFSGKKNATHTYLTSSGVLELYLDPNINPETDNITLEFLDVEANTKYHLLPYKYVISSKGVHCINLNVFNLPKITSSSSESIMVPSLALCPFQLLDESNNAILPTRLLSNIPAGNGCSFVALYYGCSGNISCGPLNDARYSDYGIKTPKTIFNNEAPVKKATASSQNIIFTVVKLANSETISLKINVSGLEGCSFNGQYQIVVNSSYDVITGTIQGIIPFEATISNITIPANSDITVLLNTSASSPYSVTTGPQTISAQTAQKSAAFDVSLRKDYIKYNFDISLKESSDALFLVAPSILFQYKQDSAEKWDNLELSNGKASFYMLENTTYGFRTDLDGEMLELNGIPSSPTDIKTMLTQMDDLSFELLEVTESTESGMKVITLKAVIVTALLADLL